MHLKLNRLLVALCLMSGITATAKPEQEFRLWDAAAPGAKGETPKDIPTLTPHWPEKKLATGAVMVICPGGGYGGLAAHEGQDYARFLAGHGVTGFVLKYRLGSAGYRHPVMWDDVSRAIRYVRANAKEWGLDPDRIGVMGSSAGGHLASTILVHFDAGQPEAKDSIDRVSSRPSLGVLCYPVISMGENTHGGSRNNLLGPTPTPELVKLLSNELQVRKDTPPTFLWHTVQDSAVKVENSLNFAAALRRQGVPFALHVYQNGAHGMGLGSRQFDAAQFHPWTRDLVFWLKEHKFTP